MKIFGIESKIYQSSVLINKKDLTRDNFGNHSQVKETIK